MTCVKHIQNKIRTHIKENNISVSALEDHAGIKRSSLQAILDNRVKSPGIEMLLKISDILDCSIDNLVGRDLNNLNLEEDDTYINKIVILEAIDFISNVLSKLDQEEIQLKKLLYAIKEICEYSKEHQKKSIDFEFANWIFKKIMK